MELPTLSPEELRRELHQNIVDLCGDVLVLDCLLFAQNETDSPEDSQAVQIQLKKRLLDYIDQHTKETVTVAEALLSHEV